ncbi:hypothetical protein MHK_002445 [Candidatus Magnetomorum sp. HK-1]|nr:hypothetical protein MHK_002445 [Candidatus Magnetomorum sp. HK-1]
MENYHGPDAFGFTASDGVLISNIGQVQLNIIPQNDPPTALNSLLDAFEDEAVVSHFLANDIDQDALTFMIIQKGQSGEGKFAYIPNANVSGHDNFTYQLSDGLQRSEIATVSVSITPINDSPILESQNVEIAQDQQAHITLMAEDADKDPLTYHILTIPDHGMASIDGAGVNYKPATGFLGVDTLTVNAFDGKVNSKTATIQIWVGIHQVDVILTEDESIGIELSDQVSVVQVPTKGIITQEEGHYVYRPHENVFGYDSFYFKATPDSNPVSMTLFIKPVNDPPSMTVQDSFIITEDQDYELQVEIFDPETSSDQLITSVTDAPDYGKIEWIGEFIKYQPFSDYNGSDSFTIRVSDGFENSFVSKTIQVTIMPSNDIPRPIAQSISLFEDESKEFKLSATDLENDPITYETYENARHGTLTGIPPDMIYSPEKDYFGKDYLSFTASDSAGTSQPQTITIVVLGTQDRPIAYDSTLEVPQDMVQVSGQLFANDPDNDLLIYSIVTQPGKGHANINNPTLGTFDYTPNPGMTGEDLLTFHVSDSYDTSNLGLVTIQIADSTLLYHQLNITIMGDYLDGDTYSYSIVNMQTHVVVKQDQVNTPEISAYLPEKEYAFYFSGDNYQPLSHTFDLMADMAIPITIQNNPDVFRLTINLQGDYVDDEPLTVKIMDANTEKVLQTIPTSTFFIFTRWIAGIYKFSVQGDNYEPYQSPAIYLDKDKTIAAALIRQTDTQLTINLTGDYQNGDPYTYKVINAENGLIVRQGQNNIQTLPVMLGQGNYRIFIIADNYDPLECQYNDQKLIHFIPDMQIQASLTQSSFTQNSPFVGISYQRIDDGLSMQFNPENFTYGMTVTLNNSIIASNMTQTMSYIFKKNETGITPIVIDGDNHYALNFEFFDGNTTKVSDYPVTYIDYGSEANEINDRSDDQKRLEDQYGQAVTIASGHKTFYPLIGTHLNINIENTLGEAQTLEIEIPPIPLDYLFIDNSTSDAPGQMMYRESDDTYRILSNSSDEELNPQPGQKLSIIVHHYCFAQSAGSGVMISFEMAEGKYAGAPVRYNPIFRDGRLSENNNEAQPKIKVPLVLNTESPKYDELSSYLTGTSAKSFLIGERGDNIPGLKQDEFQFEKINNVVYIMLTHLTTVGFDIEKDVVNETEPETSQGGDSGGGCWIEACLFGR